MTDQLEKVRRQCREVAAIIDRSQKLPSLAENLFYPTAGLRAALTAEGNYPTRRDLRDRLKRIAKAAESVHNALLDTTYFALLTETSTGLLDLPAGFADALAAIQAEAIIKSGEIPQGQGQHKLFPSPEALSARCQCALIISEAWKQTNGTDPNPDASEAHDAADLYWQTCGGRSIGEARGKDGGGGWRPYFRDVRRRTDAYFTLCRQIISDQLKSPLPPD